MTSHLATLISNAVTESLVLAINRAASRAGEAMAEEIMKDPDFRVEMQGLIRVAFAQALKDLTEPHSSAP